MWNAARQPWAEFSGGDVGRLGKREDAHAVAAGLLRGEQGQVGRLQQVYGLTERHARLISGDANAGGNGTLQPVAASDRLGAEGGPAASAGGSIAASASCAPARI